MPEKPSEGAESDGGCQTPKFGSHADEPPFKSAFSVKPPPQVYHIHQVLPPSVRLDLSPHGNTQSPMQSSRPPPSATRTTQVVVTPLSRIPSAPRMSEAGAKEKRDIAPKSTDSLPPVEMHSSFGPFSEAEEGAGISPQHTSPVSEACAPHEIAPPSDMTISFAPNEQRLWETPSAKKGESGNVAVRWDDDQRKTPATSAYSGGVGDSDSSPAPTKQPETLINPCPLDAFNAVLIPSEEWAEIRYPLWPASLIESATRAPESAGPDGSLYGMFASTELEQQTLNSYVQYLEQDEQNQLRLMLRKSPFAIDDCGDDVEREQKRFFICRFLRRSLYCVEDALDRILQTCEWLSLFAFRALDRLRVERLIESGALYFHGYDRQLRPVLVCRLSRLHWMSRNQVELLVAYAAFFFGRYLVVLGRVEQLTLLVDADMLSKGPLTQRTCLENFDHLIQTLQTHFPYFTRDIIATNVSSPSFSEGLREQVVVVSRQHLLQHIDHNQLEECMGGSRPKSRIFSQPSIYNSDLQTGRIRLVIDGIFCHGRVFMSPLDYGPEMPETESAELPPAVLRAFCSEFRDFELGYSEALARDHFLSASGDLGQALLSFQQAAEIRRHLAARCRMVDRKWSGWRSFRWSGRDRANRPVLVVELKRLLDSGASASVMEAAIGWYLTFGLNHLLAALPRPSQRFCMVVDSAGVSALMLPLKLSSLCNYLQILMANRLCTCFVVNTNFTLRRAWDALCASMRKSVRSKIVYVTEAADFQLVKKAISGSELEVSLGGKWKPSAVTRTGTSPICMFPSRRSAQVGTEAAAV